MDKLDVITKLCYYYLMTVEEVIEKLKTCKNRLDNGLIKAFITKFPRDKILSMSKEEYVVGFSDDSHWKDTFCYWLERKLVDYGSMRNGPSFKFGMWYGDSKDTAHYGWQCNSCWMDKSKDYDIAFGKIKKEIDILLVAGEYQDYKRIEESWLSHDFTRKLLSVYYPEKYFNVFNKEHLVQIKNLLEIELSDNESEWLIREKIIKWNKQNASHLNIWSFTRALYSNFGGIIRGKTLAVHSKTLTLCNIDYLGTIKPKLTATSESGITDYEGKQKAQKKVGDDGEKLVYEYEQRKLRGTPYYSMIKSWGNDVSKHYDILSYSLSGVELHIEVKTRVSFHNKLDFYITDCEVEKMKTDTNYTLYYVTEINTATPKLFVLDLSKIKDSGEVKLEPVLFRVQHQVKIK